MRARTVIVKKAYVIDFDDTLVTTTAKIHINVDGKRVKSLTPAEFNTYRPKEDEEIDNSDFTDPRIILDAKPYKMWPLLKKVSIGNKMGINDIDIYILTARSEASQIPIHTLLKRNNIDVPLERIITVGNDEGIRVDTASEKQKVLEVLASKFNNEVYFFDDSEDNVNLAGKIPGIKTKLVDWNI